LKPVVYVLIQLRTLFPKGHLFCKECIYSTLLQQKKEIKRKLQTYKEQQQKLKEDAEAKKRDAHEKLVESFDQSECGILPPTPAILEQESQPETFTTPDGKAFLPYKSRDSIIQQQVKTETPNQLNKNKEKVLYFSIVIFLLDILIVLLV